MKAKMDDLLDDVIAWVNDGSQGMTDFVHKTAQAYGVSKAEVRGIINGYDANPGSPAGRPPKSTPEVDDGDTPMYDLEDLLATDADDTLIMEV